MSKKFFEAFSRPCLTQLIMLLNCIYVAQFIMLMYYVEFFLKLLISGFILIVSVKETSPKISAIQFWILHYLRKQCLIFTCLGSKQLIYKIKIFKGILILFLAKISSNKGTSQRCEEVKRSPCQLKFYEVLLRDHGREETALWISQEIL